MSHRQAYAYLASNFTITSHALNEHLARVAELDTCLSDPSVTGKERKKLRRLCWRARGSVESYQQQLHNIDRAMTYMDFQIQTAETAAFESYVPPFLQLPPRPVFYVSDGEQAHSLSEFSPMRGSFASARSGWHSPCAEYSDSPYPSSAWSTMPCTDLQQVEADGYFPPVDQLAANNAAEQSSLQTVQQENVLEEADHTSSRASTAGASKRDEECCVDTARRHSRRHSIAVTPGLGPEGDKTISSTSSGQSTTNHGQFRLSI
jgi:hypothetical protein